VVYSSVVKALINDPKRTYILEHVGFFKDWFDQKASPEEKLGLKLVMSRNQIEISNAASVAAHDEATTYYLDIIDNFRAGAEWYKEKLEKNGFNKLQSTSAWMVDAFGHSLASMRLQKMNQMHNLIIGRASTVEKKVRGLTNELYFDWVYNFEQPSTNFNEKKPVSKENTTMKTYLLLESYCSPYSVKRTRF
jgi:Glycosyl hydrolases family 38 N-terminal domain